MPAVGDLVEAVHRYTVAGQICTNVYGFKCLDATEPFANLAVDLRDATNGLKIVMANMRQDVTTLDITIRPVEPSTPADYVLSSGTLPAGTVATGTAGELLPPQAAFVTKWSTDLGGRSYRGRVYHSGFGEAAQSAGTWVASYVTGQQTNMTAFLARYKVTLGVYGKYGLVVISRQNNGVIRPTPIGTEVTQATVRATVYNQRKRTVGVGA